MSSSGPLTATVAISGPFGRFRFGVWSLAAVLIALLVSTPVLVVAASVFSPAGEVWRHLADTVLAIYVANSLWLMLGVGAGTFAIGVSTAWLVTMCRFPGRSAFEWALLLPFAVPAYVVAFTYGGLFEFAGPLQSALREATGWGRGDYWFPEVRSLGGAVVVLTVVLYPYVYLLARAAFLEQSICVIEISRTLGRGPWYSFRAVALPLARPAIIAGVALALMEALSDFGAVQQLAVETFTTGIFRTWFGLGDASAAAQLSAVLMIFVLALVLVERGSRGRRRYHHTSRRYRALPRFRLGGAKAVCAVLACILPIFFGFLLPGAQLLAWSFQTAASVVDAQFIVLAANSMGLAGVAALLAVAVAVVLAYGQRLHPGPLTALSARVASLGYAVPGSVLAVGVLLPFAWIDNTLDVWMRASFGVSTGLLLSGTLVALLFAYLVRFLAISFNTVEASLGKVTPTMDGAARTLGLGPSATLARVHLPIISGSLMTAAILVFVDVMKELPATLIMRPFNFNTLAVRAFELASDEQLAEAAPAALTIVAVGIVPVIVLTRAIARSRPGQRAAESG
ncbi:MAG: ABC transporter permease [Alphaproteobacteria bacterium]